MKKRSFLLLPLILFGMVLAACHGSNKNETPSGDDSGQVTPGGDDTPSTVAVSSISLNPTSLTFTVGDPAQTITATVMPVNATDKTVSWSSNHPEFASVANGVVTPVAAGDAVITATAGGKSATCAVTVNPASTPGPGPGPTPIDPVTDVAITLTGYPEGKTAEHYVVHAWGGTAGEGYDYAATLSGTTLSATVPSDITGFLVAAYNGEFDWDTLVFKSSDITFVSGTTEYVIPVPTAETMTLTITDYPADKHAEHYIVHAWGGDSDPTNSVATLEGSTLTADILVDRVGFLVAAYNGEIFDWDDLVYQSANIEIVANQTTYSLSGGSTPDPVTHTYALVGSYGTHNWDDDAMAIDASGDFALIENVDFATNDQFKVRLDASWDEGKVFGWSDVSVYPAGAFAEGTDNNNIKVVTAGHYNVKFVIATSKIEISEFVAPAVPHHLQCSYTGGDVLVGNALDGTKVFVYVVDSHNVVGTVNVAADATYWYEDNQVDTTEPFTVAGSYEITVKYEIDDVELQGTMTVVVVDALVDLTGLALTPNEVELHAGEFVELSVEFTPANASDKTVEFASSDNDKATVDENGKVTAVAEGFATITVTGQGGVQATCDVTILAAYSNYVQIGSKQYEMTLNNSDLATDQEAQYELKNVTLAAGDELVFYIGGVLVDDHYGPDADDDIHAIKNNASGTETDGHIIVDNAGAADIYFKVWNGGGHSYWVTNGDALHTYGLVGKFGGVEAWGDDQALVLEGDVFKISKTLEKDDEFKIRVDGQWTNPVPYGAGALDIQDAEVKKAFGGSDNITVKYGGNYVIILNLATGKIDITGTVTDVIPAGVQVTFSVTEDVGMGNYIVVAGDFNGWSTTANVLEWSAGNVWTATFEITAEVGDTITFKFVKFVNGTAHWENDPNRTYTIVAGENAISVTTSVSWQ